MKDKIICMKELKDYPLYYICEEGYVYSRMGAGPKKNSYNNELKKLNTDAQVCHTGYKHVCIKNKEGKRVTQMVHRLVAETFLGDIPKGLTVSHLNGDKLDNRLVNLTLETLSENHKRKYEHGTMDNGYNNSRAVLNKEQLQAIRKLLANKMHTHYEIADMFNVRRGTITKINAGVRYINC